MAMTEFSLGHALAVQRWSLSLAVEAAKKQYFAKFIGTSPDDLITLQNELNKGAGEKVTIGLQMKLIYAGIEGDNIIEHHATGEEAIAFFHDFLFIDQLRKSTKSKGKMSEQRIPYDLRQKGRDALAVWWAEEMDEEIFCYLSGARGIGTMHNAIGWVGRANNALTPPDSGHLVYGGTATAKNNVTVNDKFELALLEMLSAKAETTDPMMQPFMVEGQKKFVCLLHTFQAFDLRTSTTTNDWLDITKTTDTGRGDASKLYTGKLGEYADVILHKHRNIIRFNDYGAGVNLPVARALFMGAQAGLMAYGQDSGPNRYSWNEFADDRGNALAITAGTIFGIKKTRFNSKDWGVVAIDTYSKDPTVPA
jgi:N4-gp56 family major capsid protein